MVNNAGFLPAETFKNKYIAFLINSKIKTTFCYVVYHSLSAFSLLYRGKVKKKGLQFNWYIPTLTGAIKLHDN